MVVLGREKERGKIRGRRERCIERFKSGDVCSRKTDVD